MKHLNEQMILNGLDETDLQQISILSQLLAKGEKYEKNKKNPKTGIFEKISATKDPLTSSKIRKIFAEIRRIQSTNKFEEIHLIAPRLAYDVGKDEKGFTNTTMLHVLYDEIINLIPLAAKSKSNFKNFVSLMEAIVAYHKFHGGKD